MSGDEYRQWRDMLAGKPVPIHDGRPYPGRYRIKRDGAWKPVAMWYGRPNADIMCTVDGTAAVADEVWLWCAKNPITQEAFNFYALHERWEDEHVPAASIGHNQPPASPFEALQRDVASKVAGADALEVNSQQSANLAGNWITELRDLEKTATAQHKEEKEPHLNAGRAVDEKFRPIREALATAGAALKRALTPWLNAEADRKRAAAVAAVTQGADPTTLDVKAKAGGSRGKAIALRTYKIARVIDWGAFMSSLHDNAEMRSLAQKIADKAAAADVAMVGCEIVTERRAA